ncbi:MAG: hypothetical protein MUO21_04510 [Nitrososphaeraceae archaeon]|nr:hypothetical protein [Nitrososphaeraceae archaeon]
MNEELNQTLEIQKLDIAVSAMNSALGILPIIGPLLVELVGITIPNQRFDRLIKYVTLLEKKLRGIDESMLKIAMQNENFTDLMEESLRQAVRSLSEERREYIASLIANSVTLQDIELIESKHILRLLGELNDIEIIWLRFYLHSEVNGDLEFREKHKLVLEPINAFIGVSQKIVDKSTLQNSYKEHLFQIGLLEKNYEVDSSYLPKIDHFSGAQRVRGFSITSFGEILLKQINFDSKNEKIFT